MNIVWNVQVVCSWWCQLLQSVWLTRTDTRSLSIIFSNVDIFHFLWVCSVDVLNSCILQHVLSLHLTEVSFWRVQFFVTLHYHSQQQSVQSTSHADIQLDTEAGSGELMQDTVTCVDSSTVDIVSKSEASLAWYCRIVCTAYVIVGCVTDRHRYYHHYCGFTIKSARQSFLKAFPQCKTGYW